MIWESDVMQEDFPSLKLLYTFLKSTAFQTLFTMNQERVKEFMRDFEKVLEKLRETTSVEEISELKEYFVNECTEYFKSNVLWKE